MLYTCTLCVGHLFIYFIFPECTKSTVAVNKRKLPSECRYGERTVIVPGETGSVTSLPVLEGNRSLQYVYQRG